MNLVALIGNIATDPELNVTGSGKSVCTFKVAVSRVGGDTADFFEVVCFDRQAEIANEYLYLGRRVGIEGRIETYSQGVHIVAARVQLLSSRVEKVS